jgi:hypothetical protein
MKDMITDFLESHYSWKVVMETDGKVSKCYWRVGGILSWPKMAS